LSAQADVLDRDLIGLPIIPAMTTDAERMCYYRLAREAAGKGAIVELGAWLGASTAYIAAGIRDSGVDGFVHVYDKFETKPGHIAKVRAFYDKRGIDKAAVGPSLSAFTENMGDLLPYVHAHPGLIEKMQWGEEPIALLVTDAPKRVPAISSVLTKLGPALKPGAIMAWQDFCHFPSYEIPACLYRLQEHIEVIEAVVPGTTLVFRVKSQWVEDEVSLYSLSLTRWTPEEISEAWSHWQQLVPAEKKLLFECGAAMFLCDLGEVDFAVVALATVMEKSIALDRPEVMAKWKYLAENRPDFVKRYAPLFKVLGIC
jgi:predicted O-methyltransferase YrrM